MWTCVIDNVLSRLTDPGCIGSYRCQKLNYEELIPEHEGKHVVYRDRGFAELGIISSWKNGIVFARYSMGDTAAGATDENLWLVVGVP